MPQGTSIAPTAPLQPKISRFYVGDDLYEIPEDKVDSFKSDFPNAHQAFRFKAGKDEYTIPDVDTTAFKKDFPDAVNMDEVTSSDINTEKKVSDTPKPTDKNYAPISSYDDAFSTLVGLGNIDIDKAPTDQDKQLWNENSVKQATHLLGDAPPQEVSQWYNNTTSRLDDEIGKLHWTGGLGPGAYVLPQDKEKLNQLQAAKNRANEIRDYAVMRKTSSGDPSKAISDGIEYTKYTDPKYYNNQVKYALENKPTASKGESPLAAVGMSMLPPGLNIAAKTGPSLAKQLLPEVKYNLEKTALENNMKMDLDKLNGYSGPITEVSGKMDNAPVGDREGISSEFAASEHGKNIKGLTTNYNDNLEAYKNLDSKYPKVVDRQKKIAAWQKHYDDWSATGKTLYNIGTGLANGAKDLFLQAGRTMSDISGIQETPEDIKARNAVEEEHNLLSHMDVPERSGYVRTPTGDIKIDAQGNPVTQSKGYKTVYGISDMLPALAFYAATERLGGMIGEALAPDITTAETAYKAARYAHIGDKMGLLTGLTLQNYGASYDAAKENGRSDLQSAGIASANILMQQAIFSMGSPLENLMPKLSEKSFLNELSQKATDKGVLDLLESPETYHSGIKSLQKIGLNILASGSKGAAQGALLGLSGELNKRMVTGSFDPQFMQNMKDNIVTMALFGGIPSLLGNVKNIRSIRTNIHADALWDAATNADHYRPLMKKYLDEGKINEKQYNTLNANLDLIQNAYEGMQTKDVKGNDLSVEDKKKVLLNLIKKRAIEAEPEPETPEGVELREQKLKAINGAVSRDLGAKPVEKVHTVNGVAITAEEAEEIPKTSVKVNGRQHKTEEVPEPVKPQKINIYRHGETEANKEGGDNLPNTPLNETGQKQAAELGKEWKKNGITKVITSPFRRAYQTSQIAGKEAGLSDADITTNGLLAEKSRAESVEDFANRMLAAKKEIEELPPTTAVVAHGEVMKMLKALDESGDDIDKAVKVYKESENFPNTGNYEIKGGQNATTTQEEQKQESDKQSGVGEHQGAGTPRQEAQEPQADNSDSGGGGQKEITRLPSGNQVIREDGKVVTILKDGNAIPQFKKNGDENPAYKEVVKEVADNTNFDTGEKAKDVKEGNDYEAYDNAVDESENPSEIAAIYDLAKPPSLTDAEIDDLIEEHGDPKLLALKYFADGGKVNTDEVKRIFGGRGKSGEKNIEGERKSHIGLIEKNPEKSIDRISEDMEHASDSRHPNMEYRDALIEAFQEINSAKAAKDKLMDILNPERKLYESVQDKAAGKFEHLTGIPLTDEVAEIAKNQYYGVEPEKPQPGEEIVPFQVSSKFKPVKRKVLDKILKSISAVLPNLKGINILSGDEFKEVADKARGGR
ncbi:MAG: histidine phosphatase family protein, partial [Candidatus Saccharimonadales bacterium]